MPPQGYTGPPQQGQFPPQGYPQQQQQQQHPQHMGSAPGTPGLAPARPMMRPPTPGIPQQPLTPQPRPPGQPGMQPSMQYQSTPPPHPGMGRPMPPQQMQPGQPYQPGMVSPSPVHQGQFRPMPPQQQQQQQQPAPGQPPMNNGMMMQPQQHMPYQPAVTSPPSTRGRRAYPEQPQSQQPPQFTSPTAGMAPSQAAWNHQQQQSMQPGASMDNLANQIGGMNINPGQQQQQQQPPPPQQFQPGFQQPPMSVGMPGAAAPFTPGMGPQPTSPQAGGGRTRIDPNQIPSPVAVQEADQAHYNGKPYRTCSKQMPPLASTYFQALDEGNCSPRHMRITTYNIPTSEELLAQSMLPLGLVIQPLAETRQGEAPVECVQPTESGPIRCRRCKAYINPFMTFIDGGRKFVCNFCQIENDVPADDFCNLDMSGRRVDIMQRPEFRCGSVEYIATKAYIAKPPKPVSYVFAIDVSWSAVQSGMLRKTTECLQDWLYGSGGALFPNQENGASLYPGLPANAKIAIVTYDRSIHFYNLNASLEQFQMMVVSDVDDAFVPLSTGFLVDPNESREAVEALLTALPTMFTENRTAEGCIGAVTQAVVEALKESGGRLVLLHTSLPNCGPGTLKSREDMKMFGTDKERQLFAPQDSFYKKLAEDAVSAGICIDLFLFPNAYCDIATLGVLSILTGGETFQYPGYSYDKDGYRLYTDMKRALTRPFGYNALMRVRTSSNLKVVDHFGNFYTRDGTDLELAGVDADKAFGVAVKHDGKLDERNDSAFQVALLYTTAHGERRIRVHTLCVQNTSLLGNVFRFADMDTSVNFIAKAAMSNVLNVPIRTVRDQLTEKCVKILSSYRKNCASTTSPGQLILPETFKLLPVFTLALHKSRALRPVDLSSDMRVQAMRFMKSMTVEQSIVYLYPRLLPLFDLPPEVGSVDELTGRTRLPPAVRISYERLDPSGVYLLENGLQMTIWIGRGVSGDYLESLFGASSQDAVDIRMRTLPVLKNAHSERVRAIVNAVCVKYNRLMSIQLVRQGIDQAEIEFMNALVEDKNNDTMNYVDYLCFIHKQIHSEIKASH
ncbi:COPII coat Sec23p-Sfb3p heterodimer component [Sorochytrium milnesiophthora]